MIKIEYIVDTKVCHLEVQGMHAAFHHIENLLAEHDLKYWSITRGEKPGRQEWNLASLSSALDPYDMWFDFTGDESHKLCVVSHDNGMKIGTYKFFYSNEPDDTLCHSIIAGAKVLFTEAGREIPKEFE